MKFNPALLARSRLALFIASNCGECHVEAASYLGSVGYVRIIVPQKTQFHRNGNWGRIDECNGSHFPLLFLAVVAAKSQKNTRPFCRKYIIKVLIFSELCPKLKIGFSASLCSIKIRRVQHPRQEFKKFVVSNLAIFHSFV